MNIVLLVLACVVLTGCPAKVSIETPDERAQVRAGTPPAAAAASDTIYRPMPVDSSAATFAWLALRPMRQPPGERPYPGTALEAARQFVRALGQTAAPARTASGPAAAGYARAFTYVHPRVREDRTPAEWASGLAGIARPVLVRLESLPDDSTRVFAEVLVLRDVVGQSLLGLYYGQFAAAPGDNGWQLTGARFMSEDWQVRLGGRRTWRHDRAGAARMFATEDPAYAGALIQLHSGEWVPLARPVPETHLRLGLPDLP